MKERVRTAVSTLVAVALALGLRTSAQAAYRDADTYEASLHLPPSSWLPIVSLGHREAFADLLWCRALVYQGEQFMHQAGMDLVFRYADAMVTLDPWFRAVYVWIGTAGVYQPDAVTADEVRETLRFLEDGRRRFPEDGELAWITGATWSFELPPLLPREERADARLRGTEHLMDAVRLGAAPDWLVLSNTSQLSQLGEAELAAEHLEEMYATVSDPDVQAEIAARIADLRSSAYGDAFVEANEAFEERRLRAYPYLHPSLYFLLAPEDVETADVLRDGYADVVLGPELETE